MKKIPVVVVLVLVFFLSLFLYWIYGNQPVSPNSIEHKIFVIKKGDSVRQIGNNLKKEGLIRDPVVFFVYLKFYKQDKNVQAGDYRLSPSMNLSQIVDSLNHGILDKWVTFPEGIRAEEIADLLKKSIPSYNESWRTKLIENEGYLFPDTYLIPRDADAATVVSMMRNNFKRKIEGTGLSSEDQRLERIIIIASLIEREAKLEEDMPLVSSIIQNRLKIGMKLDIDATIQYALGYQAAEKRWWKKSLTREDISLSSSYNTYLNPGLPPAPIGNPGIRAIKAALNPLSTNYIYYVSDKKGKIHPAETIDSHNSNIKKYLNY